jgi:outer membrane usher protein FimD/PapC
LGRSAQLVANLQQGDTKTATLGLSTSFHARGSGSWQWSRQTFDSPETVASSQSSTTSTHTLSIRWRLMQELSLQLQARHQERDGRPSWSGLIGLTTNWARERTSVSGYWSRQGGASFSSSARDGATVQINRSSHGLYGTQLSATHRQDETTRSDLFIRHASPFGDASLRMETTGNQPQWSASTRLWVTHDDVFFAPLGDDNLVIQDIGKPLIQISQPGRDTQRSNAKGIAVFKKVPAWSEASYTIDLKSLPFDLQLASHRVALPLASRRVYRIGHANQWSTHLEWVLEGVDLKTIHVSHHALTRQGRAALIKDDGFVDLRGAHELPLRLTPKSPQGEGSIGLRDTFDCTERNLPGILSCRRSDVLTRLPNPASQQID